MRETDVVGIRFGIKKIVHMRELCVQIFGLQKIVQFEGCVKRDFLFF